jgi:diaminopimelate decarboxylase
VGLQSDFSGFASHYTGLLQFVVKLQLEERWTAPIIKEVCPMPQPNVDFEAVARHFPTPFYLYDEAAIRHAARQLNDAFAWNEGFQEFFAVKATPNPFLLKILRQEGLGADCSSLPELLLAERAGITGEKIMLTANNVPPEEFQKARQLGAIVNLDDLGHLPFLEKHAGLPPVISFRYNPGPLKEGNAIIGRPQESKFGVTREQLFEGYRRARDWGIARFGLHTMVASNELNPAYFIETAEILFALVAELSQQLNIRFSFVNLGGGIGIPEKPGDAPVDLRQASAGIQRHHERLITGAGLPPLRIFMENGRLITGPHGVLVTRVRHIKQTYKTFVGVDATMANLMRPAMYGAYHHISVPAKDHLPADTVCDVTGSLCENNDKFAIDRRLPPLAVGDLLVIHNAGAHGHAMGFNYNGKLRSAELLLRENGDIVPIRRAETVADYFATLDFAELERFGA